MATLTVTEKTSGSQTSISESGFMIASILNNDTIIDFVKTPGGASQRITVSESLEVLESLSEGLVLTDKDGVSALINIDRIVDIESDSDRNAVIFYRRINQKEKIVSDQKDYTLLHNIYTKTGKDAFLFTTVSDSSANNTILVPDATASDFNQDDGVLIYGNPDLKGVFYVEASTQSGDDVILELQGDIPVDTPYNGGFLLTGTTKTADES